MLEKRCKYCEDYYMKGISKNVDSFVERLERGPDTLTNEEIEEEVEVEEDNNTVNAETNLNIRLNRELDLVKYW